MGDDVKPSYHRSSNSYDLSNLPSPPSRFERRARIQLPTDHDVVAGTDPAIDYSPGPFSPVAQFNRNSQVFGDTKSPVVQSPASPYSRTLPRKPVSGQYSPVPGQESNDAFSRPKPVSIVSYESAVSQESAYTTGSHNAETRLLGHAGGDESEPYQQSHIPGQPPSPPRANTVSRFLKWVNPVWFMFLFYALGIIAAISHHAFYKSLQGKEANDQLKMLRYGGIFAYLTKANFVAAVLLAYRQQIWATFRRRDLSMGAIDCLFAAADDLSAMFNLEVVRVAKSAIALAGLIWLTPLTVILTPATLNVGLGEVSSVTMCPSVRTLNFSAEMDNDWREPHRIDGLPELSLSSWNTTGPGSPEVTPFNKTFFDYYTSISSPLQQTSTISALLQRIVQPTNSSVEICGAGWNCSYTISFIAPGYRCSDGTQDSNIPFDASWLVPKGNLSYLVHATLGEYQIPQMANISSGGAPESGPPFPDHLGVFRMEPVIYVGYADLVDPSIPLPSNKSSDPDAWNKAFSTSIYACVHYETNYTIQFNYTAGELRTTILGQQFLNKIINTVYNPTQQANDGTLDNVTATPTSNYVSPLDTERYRKVAAYHSIGYQMRTYLNGSINFSQTDSPIAVTSAIQTKLIDPKTYLVKPNFTEQMQSFYLDMILSLFSNPQFLVVAWAADSSNQTGTLQSNTSSLAYPCIKTRVVNQYQYSSRDLWLVYGFAILLCGIGLVFGVFALRQDDWNGRSTRFSAILAASRARCLDNLPWSRNRYGDVAKEVRSTKLGYGKVLDEVNPLNEGSVYGFAPPDRITRRNVAGSLSAARNSVFSFQSWEA